MGTIDQEIMKPFSSIAIFVFISIFSNCQNKISQKSESIMEYVVNFKNGLPVDTVLRSIQIYDSTEKLIEEKNYYNGVYVGAIAYIYMDTSDLKKVSQNRDSITFASKNDTSERHFYKGKLIKEIIYNKNKDKIREITYGINPTDDRFLAKKYEYVYDENNKIKQETLFVDTERTYSAQYYYDAEKNLVEKKYLFIKCCEPHEPIPPDRTVYKKSETANSLFQYNIIDRTVKRNYKDKYNAYFNQVEIRAFNYDKKKKIIDSILYVINFSKNRTISIDSMLTPHAIRELRYYIYSP